MHIPELASSSCSTLFPLHSLLPRLFLSSFWLAVKAAAAAAQCRLYHTRWDNQLFLRKWGVCNNTASVCTFMSPQQLVNFLSNFQQSDKGCREVSKILSFCTFNVNKWGTCKWRREIFLASVQLKGCGASSTSCLITANLHKDMVCILSWRKEDSFSDCTFLGMSKSNHKAWDSQGIISY